MDFAWDPEKHEQNLDKHGVDFIDAIEVLSNPHHAPEVDYAGAERRHIAVGPLPPETIPPEWSGPLCAVLYTMRDEGRTCRIISARRARENERKGYRTHVGRGGSTSS
ncbi:MAG: BrnT family toxin [Bacteroidetes bacterium QH_2_67_10]|nr:MAG: BrnT family toxin [Bacteroidetes bacterium QH_2_67_10]